MATVGTLQFQLEANAAKFTAEMNKAAAQFSLFEKKLTSGAKLIQGAFAALAASKFVGFLNDSLKAQAAAEAATNKLNLALANQGKLTAETSDSLVKFAGALQETSTFADDAIVEVEALLASFGQSEEEIKRSTQAVLDYAAATGTDLVTAANLVGKAFVGNVAGLQKIGFEFTKGASDAKNFNSALTQIEQRFGGSATAATQTYIGQLEQMANAWDDTKEAVGRFLAQFLDVGGGVNLVTESLRGLQKFIGGDLIQALGEARAAFAGFLATILDGAAKAYDGLASLGGVFGDANFAKDAQERAKGLREFADGLRDSQEGLRNEAAAAAESAGKTTLFKNSAAGATKEVSALSKEAQAAAKKLADYIAALPGGTDEAAKIDLITKAWERLGMAATDAQVAKMVADLEALGKAGAKAANDLLKLATLPVLKKFAGGLLAPQGPKLISLGQGDLGEPIEQAKEATLDWHDALEDVANIFQTLSATGGPLDGILSMLGQAATAATSIGAGLSTIKAGDKAGGFGGALGQISGALGIVGSVVGLIGGLFNRGKKKAAELKKKQEEAMNAFADMFDEWKQAREELAGQGADAINSLLGSMLGEDGKLTTQFTSVANATEYVAATFKMLQASGMSTAQALEAIRPALDALATADPAALKGTAAEPLVQMANFIKANEQLVQFVSSLGMTAQALAGFGLLTQDLATRISVDMGAAIDKMVAAGLPFEQALALSAQDLYNLQQAAKQSGVTLDAHTQELINAAEAAGLFQGLEDPMKRLVELNGAMVAAIGEVVKLMGGRLPDAIQKLIDEFNSANVAPPQSAPPPSDGSEHGMPEKQHGGPVPTTGPYMLHKDEWVLNPRQTQEWLRGGGMGGEQRRGEGKQPVSVVVNIGPEKIYEMLYEASRTGHLQVHPGSVRKR